MGAVGGWYWQGQVFSQNLRNRPDIASTGEGDEFADNNYLGTTMLFDQSVSEGFAP